MPQILQLQSPVVLPAKFANDLVFPDVPGLVGYWEHEGDIERARTNLVTGQKCEVVGTPVVTADGMVTTGHLNYLRSGLYATTDFFILSVFKRLDYVNAMLVSNFIASGDSLYTTVGTVPGGNFCGGFAYDDGTGTKRVLTRNIAMLDMTAQWMMGDVNVKFAGPAAASFISLTNETTGATGSSVKNDSYIRELLPQQFEIGSCPRSSGYGGKSQILRTMIYSQSVEQTTAKPTVLAWLRNQLSFDHPTVIV